LVIQLQDKIEILTAEVRAKNEPKVPATFQDILQKESGQQTSKEPSKVHQSKKTAQQQKATSASVPMTSEATSAGPPKSNFNFKPVVEPQSAWTKVTSKKAKKTAAPASLADLLKDKEDPMKILLKKPMDEETKTSKVVAMVGRLPLSNTAQSQPILAWKTVLKEVTGHSPLSLSLVNPCVAEIFWDSAVAEEVRLKMSGKGFLDSSPITALSEKDLNRRRDCYLRGYFLPLRRSALMGFSPTHQEKLLDLAEEKCKTFTDKVARRQWLHHIEKDRKWIKTPTSDPEQEEEDMTLC
jgi:hypothetical protein